MKMNVAKCFILVIKCGKPAAVRYPRGNAIGVELTPLAELEIGRSKMVRQGEKSRF